MKRSVLSVAGLAAMVLLPAAGAVAQTGTPWLHVRVEVPVSLVDALLSGEGESANIQAAVAELQKRRGDIVSVREEDSTVRVWIDDQNAQK